MANVKEHPEKETLMLLLIPILIKMTQRREQNRQDNEE
jgi:hypothetical protein